MIPLSTDSYCAKSPAKGRKKRNRHRWGKPDDEGNRYCVHCNRKKPKGWTHG